MRAGVCLDGVGVVSAAIGAGVTRQMGAWNEAIADLVYCGDPALVIQRAAGNGRPAQRASLPSGRGEIGVTQAPDALLLTDDVVLLDRFTDADVDPLWAGEDDDYVRRSDLPGPFTRRDIADQIRHWQEQWQMGEPGRSFAVREAGTRRLVGGCVLEIRPDDGEIAELSYWVFPPYRCRGYATRSVELACRYAFDRLGVVRVELYIEPTNDASRAWRPRQASCTKASFVNDDRGHGGRSDMVLFSRLRPDGLQSGPLLEEGPPTSHSTSTSDFAARRLHDQGHRGRLETPQVRQRVARTARVCQISVVRSSRLTSRGRRRSRRRRRCGGRRCETATATGGARRSPT